MVFYVRQFHDGLAVRCTFVQAPYPYNLWCQTDGYPCTRPHRPEEIWCDRFTGACTPQVAHTQGETISEANAENDFKPDIVGTRWTGTGFESVYGPDCDGDPLWELDPARRSCYREQCAAHGQCFMAAYDAQCNEDTVEGYGCGTFTCNTPPGSAGWTGPTATIQDYVNRSPGEEYWRPDAMGTMHGCRRAGACYLLNGEASSPRYDCYDPGEAWNVEGGGCFECDPNLRNPTTGEVRPFYVADVRTAGPCGERRGDGTTCAQCNTAAQCVAHPRESHPWCYVD